MEHHSLFESASPLLDNYNAFKEELVSMYVDKQRYQTLQQKFATLRQTGSASKFAAQFKSLLRINQEARLALFTERLKGDVQKNLALVYGIMTLNELVNAAVHIDHVNYTLAKAEAKAKSKSPANKSSTQGNGKGNPTSRPPRSCPDNRLVRTFGANQQKANDGGKCF